MRTFLTLALFVFLISSCKKSITTLNNSQTENTSKLISIINADLNNDSTANPFFYYTGNYLSDVYFKYTSNNNTYHFAHLDYTGDDYIKVTSPKDEYRYTEYYLNNFKLPITIIKHIDNFESETMNFSYKQDTKLLDSVDITGTSSYRKHYEFNYEDDNITDVFVTYYYQDRIGKDSMQYTYDISTPNIFTNTDPLLYIYEDPFANGYTYVSSAFFKLFSTSTYNTFTFNFTPYTFTDTLSYTLDANNKISSLSRSGYTQLYNYE